MVDLKQLPKLIVVEGINGSGKTTFIQALQDILDEQAIPNVVLEMIPQGPVRDAVLGENNLSEEQRLLLLRCASLGVQRDIKYALAEGKWIIMDRGWVSYLTHQGSTESMKFLLDRVESGLRTNFPKADFLVYIDVDVMTAMSRRKERDSVDHFETDDIEHEEMLRERMMANVNSGVATKAPESVIWVDGGLPTDLASKIAMDEIRSAIEEDFQRYKEHTNA